jgi:ribonucleotide reductase alpha subunit
MESEVKVKVITKFINTLYEPIDIEISTLRNYETAEIVIDVFFDEIDDKYITNSRNNNIKQLKEKNFELQIRKDIYNFFGIMTSGLSLEGFSPYKHHGISIKAHLT